MNHQITHHKYVQKAQAVYVCTAVTDIAATSAHRVILGFYYSTRRPGGNVPLVCEVFLRQLFDRYF